MRALIVDDEAPARAKVRRLLAASGDVEVVGEASTGREAIAAIKRLQPDVVFLDVQMPGLDGFDVAELIEREGGPRVVFITANDTQASRAFDVGAVDYLLKPFTPERFERLLERVRAGVSKGHATGESRPVPPPAFLQRVLVIDNGRALFLPVNHVDRIESERNYVHLHGRSGSFRLRASIGALHERLDPIHFLRINRSTIVRLDAIRSMDDWSHGDLRVVMQDGTELIWSRRFRVGAERVFGVES